MLAAQKTSSIAWSISNLSNSFPADDMVSIIIISAQNSDEYLTKADSFCGKVKVLFIRGMTNITDIAKCEVEIDGKQFNNANIFNMYIPEDTNFDGASIF